MKHLLLFLYFISYTSGIGAITLGLFFYIKTKNLYVKYVLIADIAFTSFLFFDNLNFYTDIFIHRFPFWMNIVKILGLTLSGILIIYFFTLSAYSILNIEISKHKKIIYFGLSSIFFIICISSLYILYHLQLISELAAVHSCFFLPNIFTSIGIIYDVFFIIKNLAKFNNLIRQFLKMLIILTCIITPISILTNVLQYWHFSNIPIAYSPIEYFLFNLSALIFVKKNLQQTPNILIKAEFEQKKISNETHFFDDFSNTYNLTQREIEITKLVSSGLSNQEIAENLFISANTVRNHIYNIYKKTGIKNRYELINLISTKYHNH